MAISIPQAFSGPIEVSGRESGKSLEVIDWREFILFRCRSQFVVNSSRRRY